LLFDDDVYGYEQGVDDGGKEAQIGPVVDASWALSRFDDCPHVLAYNSGEKLELGWYLQVDVFEFLLFLLIYHGILKHQTTPFKVNHQKLVVFAPIIHIFLIFAPHFSQKLQ
jgi:hypothetical protein